MDLLRRYALTGAVLIGLGLGLALVGSGLAGIADAGPNPPPKQTHLGVPAEDMVTLIGTIQVASDKQRFTRLHADGTSEFDEFVVPEGKTLVVTDFEYWYRASVSGIRTSVLFIQTDPGGTQALCMDDNGEGDIGGGCWSGTSGFAVASGSTLRALLKALVEAGSTELRKVVVRGYVVGRGTGGGGPDDLGDGGSGGGRGGGGKRGGR